MCGLVPSWIAGGLSMSEAELAQPLAFCGIVIILFSAFGECPASASGLGGVSHGHWGHRQPPLITHVLKTMVTGKAL